MKCFSLDVITVNSAPEAKKIGAIILGYSIETHAYDDAISIHLLICKKTEIDVISSLDSEQLCRQIGAKEESRVELCDHAEITYAYSSNGCDVWLSPSEVVRIPAGDYKFIAHASRKVDKYARYISLNPKKNAAVSCNYKERFNAG